MLHLVFSPRVDEGQRLKVCPWNTFSSLNENTNTSFGLFGDTTPISKTPPIQNTTRHCTDFQSARLADKLQVLVSVLGLVLIDDLFNIIGDLRKDWGSRGAEYSLQLLVEFTLHPGVPSGVRQGKGNRYSVSVPFFLYSYDIIGLREILVLRQIADLDRKTSRKDIIWYPPDVLAEALLQSFDPGLALFHCSHVASLCHLLCNLREYVTVLQAALQSPLHRVLPPYVEQIERLLVRPGNFCVRYSWERAFLRVWNKPKSYQSYSELWLIHSSISWSVSEMYRPVYSPHIEIRGDSPEFSPSTDESLQRWKNSRWIKQICSHVFYGAKSKVLYYCLLLSTVSTAAQNRHINDWLQRGYSAFFKFLVATIWGRWDDGYLICTNC